MALLKAVSEVSVEGTEDDFELVQRPFSPAIEAAMFRDGVWFAVEGELLLAGTVGVDDCGRKCFGVALECEVKLE